MVSHLVDVFRAGLLASFTGGWFFDTNAGIFSFTNAAHLYLWLFLFCYPFALYLAAGSSTAIWCVYCITIALLFLVVKWLNRKLHRVFDGEIETERVEGEEEEEANRQRGGSKQLEDEGKREGARGELESGDVQLEGLPDREVENKEQEQVSELETSFIVATGESAHSTDNLESEQRKTQRKDDVLESFGKETPSDSSHSDEVFVSVRQRRQSDHIEGEELAAALASLPRKQISDPCLPSRSGPTTEVNVTVHDVSTSAVPRQASEGRGFVSSVQSSDTTAPMPDTETCTQSVAESKSASDITGLAASNSSYVPTLLEKLQEQERDVQSQGDENLPDETVAADESRHMGNHEEVKTADDKEAVGTSSVAIQTCGGDNKTTALHKSTRNMTVTERLIASGISADQLVEVAGGGPDRPSVHIALSDNDTSAGSVHCYLDEFGRVQAYMFVERGDGIPQSLELNLPADFGNSTLASSNDSNRWTIDSDSTVSTLDFSEPSLHDRLNTHLQEHHSLSIHSDTSQHRDRPVVKYRFKLLPFFTLPISFDRLALVTFLDRDKNWLDIMVSVFMATVVSVLGYWLLLKEFYLDFWILWFCFVVGSCQYCLMKSVDPDSASPAHGDNSVIRLSRAVYFCVIAVVILVLDAVISSLKEWEGVHLYGLSAFSSSAAEFARDALAVGLLFFPVVFLLGLLPQVNTFTTYMLEQLDIHMFGGIAATSLVSATFNFCRSLLSVGILYGFAYAASQSDEPGKAFIFSVFIGVLVGISYLQSRLVGSPKLLWEVFAHACGQRNQSAQPDSDTEDPLPLKLRSTVRQRLSADLLASVVVTVVFLGVHASSAFADLQPALELTLYIMAAAIGFVTHYLLPQLRKQLPWLCFANPILRSAEYNRFEVTVAARLMWFERVYSWLGFLERNVIYPAVFMSGLTTGFPLIVEKFGSRVGALIITVCGLKMMRSGFVHTSWQFVVVSLTVLLFKYDFPKKDYVYCQTAFCSETFPIDYFFASVFLWKFRELVQKTKFVFVYIVPWQIPWGSAFHAFAQPLSIPHSAMMFFQLLVSAAVSSPLSPILGSAIFVTSYVRPIKFWERDYNTKRVDHSNTRLAVQLDRDPGGDDNNLNSIFYEHLTRSLQQTLAGDLVLGRWGRYTTGDCFILASDYLNALVHIIEIGNGLVTFQLRGLEFRGTYCQQREVEAITEGVDDDEGCCCCTPGHAPGMLSINASFTTRWLAWEVTTAKYVVEGYSITDNNAASMLQVFELRKILITYYVQAIIYYAVTSPKLQDWLSMSALEESVYIPQLCDGNFKDLDPTFNSNVDDDYDHHVGGISRTRFVATYYTWIRYCVHRSCPDVDCSRESSLVSLCFALSALGRRALGTASQHQSSVLESFLYGLHALVKGDFRITATKDEWVFADMDLLHKVVSRGVRMALQLHQDHFASPDEYDDSQVLYDAIRHHDETMVICHEGDPAWRHAVLSNRPSLLSLRHVVNEGTGEYKIIMLNRRFLNFRVVKVNSDCVQGLWAGQQQELVFFRNRNPERGSIQNAKQVLRNMINSSCDQPIGYPIYVSPLTTSFITTHPQLRRVTGRPVTFGLAGRWFQYLYTRLRTCLRERQQNPSSSAAIPTLVATGGLGSATLPRRGMNQSTPSMGRTPNSLHRHNIGSRLASNSSLEFGIAGSSSTVQTISSKASGASGSNLEVLSTVEELGSDCRPRTSSQVAGVDIGDIVQITDISQMYLRFNIDHGVGSGLRWPNEEWRSRGGASGWDNFRPREGACGTVVHRWKPFHRDPVYRSILDKPILLVEVEGTWYVPISEAGVAVQV